MASSPIRRPRSSSQKIRTTSPRKVYAATRRRVDDHGLGVSLLAFVAAGSVAIVLPDREPMTVTDA
jgi:hypothetical protein